MRQGAAIEGLTGCRLAHPCSEGLRKQLRLHITGVALIEAAQYRRCSCLRLLVLVDVEAPGRALVT